MAKKRLHSKKLALDGVADVGMFKNDYYLTKEKYKQYSILSQMKFKQQVRSLDYFDSKCYNSVLPFKKK